MRVVGRGPYIPASRTFSIFGAHSRRAQALRRAESSARTRASPALRDCQLPALVDHKSTNVLTVYWKVSRQFRSGAREKGEAHARKEGKNLKRHGNPDPSHNTGRNGHPRENFGERCATRHRLDSVTRRNACQQLCCRPRPNLGRSAIFRAIRT